MPEDTPSPGAVEAAAACEATAESSTPRIVDISIGRLRPRADARSIDADRVTGMAESIRDGGLIHPILVRLKSSGEGDAQDYEIIAGVHRYRAAQTLDLPSIPCRIVQLDDIRAELAMIDENLMRAELSPSDRARSTARRKVLYVELHPETGHGSPGVSRLVGDTGGRATTKRFTAETAGATGRSERAVQRDAERGERVTDEAFRALRGTALDTGAYLDKLKAVPQDRQAVTVKADLAEARSEAKSRQMDRIAAETVEPADDMPDEDTLGPMFFLISEMLLSDAERVLDLLNRVPAETFVARLRLALRRAHDGPQPSREDAAQDAPVVSSAPMSVPRRGVGSAGRYAGFGPQA